jgi:ATP-dependent Lhr-like helicase
MVGLSATVGSPEKVAQFLVGNQRQVEIVRVSVAKMVNLKVIYPKPTEEDVRFAGKSTRTPKSPRDCASYAIT